MGSSYLCRRKPQEESKPATNVRANIYRAINTLTSLAYTRTVKNEQGLRRALSVGAPRKTHLGRGCEKQTPLLPTIHTQHAQCHRYSPTPRRRQSRSGNSNPTPCVSKPVRGLCSKRWE